MTEESENRSPQRRILAVGNGSGFSIGLACCELPVNFSNGTISGRLASSSLLGAPEFLSVACRRLPWIFDRIHFG
jgi:hypothetical protein